MSHLLSIILLLGLSFQVSLAQPKIIFDTDFGGDADDLGALAMLHNLVEEGECDLIAVMCWSTEKYAVSAIDAVNRYYQHPNIPIGMRKDPIHEVDWNHSKTITESFEFKLTPDNAPETTDLYRKILSSQEDQSVTIVTVGPLKNIERLIRSESDQYSSMNGKDLIRQKVKEFVIMGGQYPSGENEWNFNGNMPGVTKYVLENIPVPITFLGYEVGLVIKTGSVFNQINPQSPLYIGFHHFSKHAPWMNDAFKGEILDNATYDQTAVLYAVRGGIGKYWDRVADGTCVADSTGGNTWEPQTTSDHSYLKLKSSPEEMAELIEHLMLNPL